MLSQLSITATELQQELDWLPLVMGLFGGLALFLFGMEQMAEALKAVAGDRMKVILAALTKNRFMGVLTGAFVTAVIQSSSVTTVLVVGFITAGLMSMAQSIGVIMGANIGTTITAQIIAFKVTKFALGMVAVGYGLIFGAKQEQLKRHGHGILGLGLVFLGMSVMGEAMRPLRSYGPFLSWMTEMEHPGLGILAGAVFTALIQSSSATTAVVIVMAGQGLISLPAGIAMAFGANIGTCVTALLASIGKPREALRAAVVHVLFNVAGVLLWLAFIDQLAGVVRTISPVAQDLSEGERLAAETPRQIANAHTIFNIANTAVFIWMVPLFARLVQWLVPDLPLAEAQQVRAKYLDAELLTTPSLALDRCRMELLHMGALAREMLESSLSPILHGSRTEIEEVRDKDDAVDTLHGHIVTYLGKVSRTRLSERQTQELIGLLEAANDLENIGDIIETNLVSLGLSRIDRGVIVSEATRAVLVEFHAAVVRSLDNAIIAIAEKSQEAAATVVSMKDEINRLADSAAVHEARRLVAEEPNRLEAYTLETDILANLKRIYYFSKRMARMITPPEA